MKHPVLFFLASLLTALTAMAQSSDYIYIGPDSLPPDASFRIDPKTTIAVEVRAALPRKQLDSLCWGIAWNCVDGKSECLTVSFSSGGDDIVSHNVATVRRFRRTLAGDSLILSRQFSNGFDFSSGFNSLACEWRDGRLDVSGGNNHVDPLFSLDDAAPLSPFCRLITCAGLRVDCIVVERTNAVASLADSAGGWTPQLLDSRFALSSDPLEGYWEHFDMQADYDHARPGGDYRLAIVRADTDTYNILYISGARTNAAAWSPCMLKGRLRFTPFADNYTLEWYDAMMQPVDSAVGANATLENRSLLSLAFPRLGFIMRLARKK